MFQQHTVGKHIPTTNLAEKNALGGIIKKSRIVRRGGVVMDKEYTKTKMLYTRKTAHSQPDDQPDDQPAAQPVDQPVDQPDDQPADQPINDGIAGRSFDSLIGYDFPFDLIPR